MGALRLASRPLGGGILGPTLEGIEGRTTGLEVDMVPMSMWISHEYDHGMNETYGIGDDLETGKRSDDQMKHVPSISPTALAICFPVRQRDRASQKIAYSSKSRQATVVKRARMAGKARRDFRDANSTWRSGVRPGPGHVIHRSSRRALLRSSPAVRFRESPVLSLFFVFVEISDVAKYRFCS